MCINYTPPSREEIKAIIDVDDSVPASWPEETWQDYAAPVVRQAGDRPQLIVGTYGMLPKAQMPPGKQFATMNARAETIGEKRAYQDAWRRTQTCLIPVKWFYEPNYATGKAVRWAIGMDDESAFCVAGLWRAWKEEQGGVAFSFTQITINADDHPVMRQFQQPDDEKRSLVIVPRASYGDWLSCDDPEAARSMLNLYPAERMRARPAPKEVPATTQGSLF